MKQPLVTCIMPTANREKYLPFALDYFLQQDYPNRQLVIIDDGHQPMMNLLPSHPQIKYYYGQDLGTIGTKRNYACARADGEIIVHWDDDEWYASDWLSKQVDCLTSTKADICGLEFISYYSPVTDILWLGSTANRNNPSKAHQWLNGPTIAYWKSYWDSHPFQNLQKGEDDEFVSNPEAYTYAHDYLDGFVKILHPENTTIKYFEDPRHKK